MLLLVPYILRAYLYDMVDHHNFLNIAYKSCCYVYLMYLIYQLYMMYLSMVFMLGLGNISILLPLCNNIRACNINIANIFSHINSIVCAIYRRILPHIAEHYCSF